MWHRDRHTLARPVPCHIVTTIALLHEIVPNPCRRRQGCQLAVRTPPSHHDPYELDRLAQVQAARNSDSDSQSGHHELPAFVPLSHHHPLLSADQPFDVDAFLLTRTHTKLPDLRVELREYLATLKEELVQLINDDYAAFISLSTDLRGEGATLDRLKWPLGGVKSEIEVCKMVSSAAMYEGANLTSN